MATAMAGLRPRSSAKALTIEQALGTMPFAFIDAKLRFACIASLGK